MIGLWETESVIEFPALADTERMTASTGRPSSTKGTFVISLDTELSWGCFDTVGVDQYREAYRNTRSVIDGLCDLFDTYDAPATWAMVMHLFEECSGHEDAVEPTFDWIDSWYRKAPCATEGETELWYAPDVLERIRATDIDHELGVHGYSHVILGDPGCSREAATEEIRRAVAVAERLDVGTDSFVFPRNEIGHLDLLERFGFQCFRGLDARWYEASAPSPIRRACRFGDEFLGRTPPTVTPSTRSGLIEIPGSQILRPDHGHWKYTPASSQVTRAIRGLDRAADRGEIFHLWFHPFNFGVGPERHLDMFERILAHAAKLRRDGRLEIEPMNAIDPPEDT